MKTHRVWKFVVVYDEPPLHDSLLDLHEHVRFPWTRKPFRYPKYQTVFCLSVSRGVVAGTQNITKHKPQSSNSEIIHSFYHSSFHNFKSYQRPFFQNLFCHNQKHKVHSRRWLVFNNVAVTLRPAHPPTSTCVTILSSDFQVYRLQFYSLQSLQQFDDWMIRYDDPVFLPPWWFCFVHFAECIALHARIGFHDGWWLQFLVLWIGNRVDAVSQWMIFWSMMSIQSNYKHNY